ncbi:DedA family protein [Cuniculiplasma divulgatum]|uniref:DedA family protein n=1 Tax=Cuniculiplasma divulgatum TaxID=1673428 RepID=A0A1N5VQT8_9ARCH|nr:DedA family protein [Cuniculiplasma divulgatum]EQB69457.1 MAG: hypothetical protein AMDU5_GPLC00003G0007 [Thermoplasmatales archaeon Gpl]MCI2412542.1 DedA family protein [Cuniculiplasma sp.]WMT49601.1 MAG: DedA family protein [Thermoplasmatales archaeon]SIM75168.1 DedA family protein [Cuniculiplasma divulgatum]SJK85261.1 DedA family protein [Cuniculiplasma divulgatum]
MYRFLRSNLNRYYLYAETLLIVFIILSSLDIANGYFHYISIDINLKNVSFGAFEPIYKLGYLGMFIIIAFGPLPDDILVPFYGYLAFVGLFNVYATLFVSVLAMLFVSLIEYLSGRFAGRELLLKALSKIKIREKDINKADDWIATHGTFSIFISTFIPYGKVLFALGAGILKMKFSNFTISITSGYLIRFIFLIYIGYGSFRILTSLFSPLDNIYFVYLDIFSVLSFVIIYMQRGTLRREKQSAILK